MVDIKDLNDKINTYLLQLKQKTEKIIQFVIWRLKNYTKITIAEQIAYPCILIGISLILSSFILMLL
jgi:hypothetical protein